MHASAMRCVDRLQFRLAFELARRHPRVHAALGSVTMKNVDLELGGKAFHLAGGLQVAETEIGTHRNSDEAERAVVGEAGERGSVPFASRIANYADLGAELGLANGEIMDVTKQAPDGRMQAMQNAKRGAHRARTKAKDGSVSFRRSA